ncbi:MAG: hypothetical protein ACT4OV_07905 [Microthrixaceae bacterium]
MKASAKAILMLVAVVASLLVGAGPAAADYHGLCGPGPGDTHNLTSSGGQLRATGSITCTGRTITVQKFQILDVAAQQVVASLPETVCGNSCAFEITTPVAAGYYEVSLQFHVSGNGGSNFRQSEYVFVGSGQPTKTCGFRFGVPVNCV